MKHAFVLLIVLSLAGLPGQARADEQTQAVQQTLKDQGFYYGDVDGQGGPETDAAIRRYQIRQGLDVTGKMDEQTLSSLNLNSKNDKNTIQAVPPPPSGDTADAQPVAPKPQETQPPDKVMQNDQDFLRHQPHTTPAPAPEEETAPQPPQPAQPPEEAGQATPEEYAHLFRKTPYETAPAVVQRGTVQRAQERLAREGFFRGVADGKPSDSLSRALAAYQRDADISITGRLDMETLSDMNLLPRRHVIIRPPGPLYDNPVDGRGVYRGIWVR